MSLPRLMLGFALLIAAVAATAGGGAEVNGTLAGTVRVDNARLRALLPGQSKTAGYFDITNNGLRPLTLVGASSDGAGAIEIHRSVHDGDIVRMRRVERVVVAPAETVGFRPGGLHLMLFRVPSLAPETLIRLNTSDGEQIDTVFTLIAVGVE